MNAVLDELTWRGLIAHSTDLEAMAERMDQGPVSFYVGFDPTGPSLHIGHLIQLVTARRLQDAGHKPVLLVGGATGLIGDPKDTGERVMNSPEVVAGWVERLRDQARRFVSFEGENAATMVNNLDWTSQMNVVEFLRDIGKHFPVNRMLARDIVAKRLEAGISFTEFSYVLLQSMDYLQLHRLHGVDLQTGGSDQWGNITAGVDLIRRVTGDHVHALSTPLLTKADGTKFGKTEGGGIWIDPEMTSPYAFHQFFLNAEDAKVIEYLKVFSPRGREEIDELEALTASEPHRRAAQRALADDITDLVHGREEREAATQAAAALFGRAELDSLPESTLAHVAREVGGGALQGAELPTVAEALQRAGVVASRSAGRRAIEEGGAYLNNQKVTDTDAVLSEQDFLAGTWAVLRRGRRTIGLLQR
ncbi:tyrosine--tRNA ligase [Aestuariimicrobium sp. p3-SID1156]|uniref:tyrosine--tRNA ligase n=1 Tax=Aestuariimicrobium sp. p3-SID1156 TaxID=2916038 RepID=UPI00223AD52D|nr:tyrosine--tRNA ligase [Aestuariimicrobium sp. p3-SID1156]MCT1460314.1 tyrosine--tRNA ligase [Aestuariimicrobium sp. p3-SID1156]